MTSQSEATAHGLARRRLVVKRVILPSIAVLAVVAGFLAFRTWHRPLGPDLVLSTVTPSPTAAITSAATLGALSVPTIQPTYTPIPLCGGPPIMYLLVVGKDTDPENFEIGFADAIRIARIDFTTPSIAVLAIPRDLMVRIPGLEVHQIVEERLRMAYAYGYAYDVPGGGPSLLAQTLMLNFGVQIDHYAVANYVAFEQMVDAVGGIDVYVNDPMGQYDMGWVHMNGEQALAYARTREHTSDRSDLNRIDRQTQVMNAIRERVLSPDTLPILPTLVNTMDDAILTDLSPSEVSALMCLAQKIDASRLQVTVIDPTMYARQNDAFDHELLLPDFDAIRALILDFNTNGLFEIQSTE